MTILTIPQALNYARNAGFSGNGLITIVAIGLCESGLNTSIRGQLDPRDRGWLQINSFWHPEVSDSVAFDPQGAANAAYRISARGTNFSQWHTYPFCSATKMSQVSSMANIPSGGGLAPWYTFPRIDNLGGVEPFGGFPKPDSNIQLPTRYPVTALASGIVTAIDGGNVAWGGVVTIKLDSPINSMATHMAYLHLASETVTLGQHVSQGQLIGLNGGSAAQGTQKVPLGFALYAGDHYGFGSEWSLMTRANLNGGPLDPVPLLNAAAGGKLPSGSPIDILSGLSASLPGLMTNITNVSYQANQIINQVPGFSGICEALDIVEQFVPFTLPTNAATDVAIATQNPDINIFGWDIGLPNPFNIASQAQAAIQLPSDSIQAILVYTTTNLAAFLVRAFFVTIGLIMFAALMINLQSEVTGGNDKSGGGGISPQQIMELAAV